MDPLRQQVIRLAHANPALRPHLLPLLKEAGTAWRAKLKSYDKKPNHYIHFSNREILGINPNSDDAPLGLYVYPADLTKVSLFAADRPYILIIKNNGARILNLRVYTEQEYQRDLAKLTKAFPKQIKKALEDVGKIRDQEMTPGKRIWSLTEYLVNSDKHKWSNLFLSVLNYEAVEDDCEGIIWQGEDCQAVFLSVAKLELVDTIKKKVGDIQLVELVRNYSHKNLSGKELTFVPAASQTSIGHSNELTDMDFNGANLSRSTILEARMARPDFTNANLTGATVRNADIQGADFTGANLRDLKFTGGDLQYTRYPGADLTNAAFRGVNISGADFTGCTLVNTTFRNAQFIITKFTGTKLRNVSFEESVLHGTDFTGCTLTGVDFSQAKFNKPNFAKARYDATTRFPEGFNPAKAKMKPL